LLFAIAGQGDRVHDRDTIWKGLCARLRGLVIARWIVSPAYDLTFFIGGAALVGVFLGIYLALVRFGLRPSGHAQLYTYAIYTCVLDLPHIFQTFSRTHADATEHARRRRLYTWGIPFVMLAGLVVPATGLEDPFVAFVALYGSHHIVRQHVGFLKIYQGLNEPYSRLDRFLDRMALELGLYTCIVHDYAVDAPTTWHQTVTVYGTMQASFPAIPERIVEVADAVALVALAAFCLRQVVLVARGGKLNLPKLLLMGAALTTHLFVFVVASVPFLLGEVLETAYHDAQYHGFVAHYQRRRFPGTRSVARRWLGASLVYGVVAGTVETLGYTRPVLHWLFAPFEMLTLFHYFIDGRIWRIRDCPELRDVLFGPRGTPVPHEGAAHTLPVRVT
jgi:hypothetical protein